MKTKKYIDSFFYLFSRKRYWFFVMLVFILLWMVVIAPFLLRIPDNFSYEADMVSVDNIYDETLGSYR
jgi:PDZ domain-containing secreted protein